MKKFYFSSGHPLEGISCGGLSLPPCFSGAGVTP